MPEKRGLDRTDADERQPDSKRPKVPALASVIVEALKVDSLQKFCSSLEPILRRIVSEELERALAKLAPSSLGGRSSPKRIEGPDGRNLQLHFRSRLSLPLFTGGKVEGEQGVAIHVLLLDATTGHVVQSGPESSAKLDIVVLEGDFDDEDDDGWSEEDFESHVVRAREGKRPLLTGDLQVSLKEGVGTLGELVFTDNSSWIRSRKFRLGLKVASGFCEGTRIREAKTEAFTVKDHRGELYKKHYPPALKDEVWRLEKIGKDGSFHKRLNKAEIYRVEDFLRLVVRDPQRLRNILGSGMSNKMWESLVEHAKTCVLSGTHYVYYLDDTKNVGAVFSNICEFIGLISGGQYCSAECLTDHQKVFADTLVKKAYDNWTCVTEYDGESLLNFKKNKKLLPSQIELPSVTANYPASCDQDAPQHHLCEQPSTATRTMIGADTVPVYTTSNHLNRYPSHAYDVQYQFPQNSHQAQIMGNAHTGLSLGPPQQASLDFQPMCESLQPMNLVGYDDWSHQRDYMGVEDILSEEDIRMRSNEMLESEDMQHLLRGFSMGGATTSFPEDGYNYPPYMATPATPTTPTQSSSSEGSRNHSRSSGKAVVGWLKIKAAMRWGIFVRKKAAQRRARLVELED